MSWLESLAPSSVQLLTAERNGGLLTSFSLANIDSAAQIRLEARLAARIAWKLVT